MRRPHEVIAAVLVAAGFAFGQNPQFRIEGELVMSPARQVFAVADLNGDGHPDLVASDPDGILLNDGNGSFTPLGIPNTAVTNPFDLYQAPILTAADFDGNG